MRKVCLALVFICALLSIGLAQAQEATSSTPSGGIFSLYSKPSGALVYMEGDYNFVGHTPCEVPFNLVGTYRVKAQKHGFENWSTKVTLVGDQQNSLYIKLVPKTRWKAAARSAIFPGWGQYYTDRKIKGVIFGILQAGSVLGTVFAYQEYEDAKDEYYLARDRYLQERNVDRIPELREEMRKKGNDADEAWEVRSTFIGLSAAIWAYNVMESVLFFPRYDHDLYDRSTPLITGSLKDGETRLLLTHSF